MNLDSDLHQRSEAAQDDDLSSPKDQRLEVFFSYAPEDERFRERLEKYLSPLRREGIITGWHDRKILPGDERNKEIDAHLNSAKIILLLISADFMASDYAYDIEMMRAMERHEVGEARVIPIILSPVDWKGAPFGKLQALPSGAKPIREWPYQDKAFDNIARGIRTVAEEMIGQPSTSSSSTETPIETWLANSRFDFSDLIKDRTQHFTKREWVFQLVGQWLSQGKESMFLLTGGPGTGKTAIAARLIQFSKGDVTPPDDVGLPSIPFLAAVHICSARDTRTIDPRLVVGSIAGQLAARYPAFKQAVLSLVSKPQDLDTQELWNLLLLQPLAKLTETLDTSITILVDSMDEALQHRTKPIVVDLLKASGQLSNVRWLLTSRDEGAITDYFYTARRLDLITDAPWNINEVRDYAIRRLTILADNTLTPDERNELADRIAAPDQGNFLYARYILDDLIPRLDKGEKLQTIRLPDNLAGIYREFLDRLVAKHELNNEQAWKEVYRPLLGALATALGDGLERDTLAGVSGLLRQDVLDSLQALRSYWSATDPSGPYRLYHQSFGDFLLDEQANTSYWIDPATAHLSTAQYLLKNWARYWPQATSEQEADPEFAYAIRYTPSHLLAALEIGDRNTGWKAAGLLSDLLTDLGYLGARLRLENGSTWSLEQEYNRAMEGLPRQPEYESVAAYREALNRESYALRDRPEDCFVQIYD